MAQDNDGQFKLNLFQCFQLWRDGKELHVASRQQRLIAALAINGPRPRRYYSGLLWTDSPEARAMESLRTSIYLTSSQVPGLLANDGQVLSLSERVTVDLHNVVNKVKRLGELGPELSDDTCLACLHCGDLLPGWYDDWVFLEQQRLRNIRLRAFLMLARRWIDEGDAQKAVEAAESALELEPLHESAVELLIKAELKAGNRARALRTFQAFRTNLALELGIEPSEHLARLAAGINSNRT
jgi:SARP family transcriptional regulator, regulator of embCAB operon